MNSTHLNLYNKKLSDDIYKALKEYTECLAKAYNDHLTLTGEHPKKLIIPVEVEILGMKVEFTNEGAVFTKNGHNIIAHVFDK